MISEKKQRPGEHAAVMVQKEFLLWGDRLDDLPSPIWTAWSSCVV